jgi:ketosteroid isomerase-like protein
MSQQNVEIARRYYELLNLGDLGSCAALLADDFELVEPSLPDADPYRGAEGLRLWYERMTDAWSDMRWEVDEFIDAGEFVLVPVRFHSRGRHTGLEQVSALRFHTIRVEHGRVALATGYGNRAKALAVVGLSE